MTQNTTGKTYWRSLEEYAGSPELRDRLAHEFAGYDPEAVRSMSRRRFMQLAGASMALAGVSLSGCRRWPEEKLAPFAARPETRVPGQGAQYASLIERHGVATGLLVSQIDGRPIKIEGNPEHPFSLGATDAITQASLLELYDPDRARVVRSGRGGGSPSGWGNFASFARGHFQGLRGGASSSLAVLAEASDSPSLAAMRTKFAEAFPGARWHTYDPLSRDHELAGARMALGQAVRPVYRLDRATVIACFDSDLLFGHPAALRHARDWAKGRASADQGRMNRLYVAEPSFTITGSNADERLAARSGEMVTLLRALGARLGVPGVSFGGSLNGSSAFIDHLSRDLRAHASQGVVVAGPGQPAEVHALVWAINDRLKNLGRTIELAEEPRGDEPTGPASIAELARAIDAGEVTTLVVLGGNPAYDAPAELNFAQAMEKLDAAIHLSLDQNETSLACDWTLPRAHALESWGDGRAWDGTVSVQQPLILPLFAGRTPIELLALILDQQPTEGYDIVRETFREMLGAGEAFEAAWRKVLHDGLVADSARLVTPIPAATAPASLPEPAPAEGFEVQFVADEKLDDGRYANNGWLQELPASLTKVTWDNPALIAIEDARRLGLNHGDMVSIRVGDRSAEFPVYLMPGQAAGTVTLSLGYGRTASGAIGRNVGFNAYPLRTAAGWAFAPGAAVEPTGATYELATTQNHALIDASGQWAMDARVGQKGASGKVIREATLAEYRKNPQFVHKNEHGDHSLQLFESPSITDDGTNPPPAYPGAPEVFNRPHAWGMAIDMNSCTGCNACVIACQAENNIPVAGKDQVAVSREMHWLRIDTYFKGDPAANPDVVRQPMMCVHCENAPCEQVCPVAATVHDTEGLNTMVYNRCIGTRYCSNNCPYKVRRFNYFDYHAKDPRGMAKPWLGIPDTQSNSAVDQIKRMVHNPDVTVRMRGVMEKCTYCVQRISRAKIDAKARWAQTLDDATAQTRAQPTLKEGEVVTACQQVCPTQAIVFGNLNNPDSRVSKLQKNNRAYKVLGELNVRPRTKHLAKVRNPAHRA